MFQGQRTSIIAKLAFSSFTVCCNNGMIEKLFLCCWVKQVRNEMLVLEIMQFGINNSITKVKEIK